MKAADLPSAGRQGAAGSAAGVPPVAGGIAVPVESAVDPAAEIARETVRWSSLVAQLGAEIAGPLTDAIERLTTMSTSGRIDQAGLRALRAEVESARLAGMLGQQLARLASGRVRQSHERVHLTHTLQGVLGHRARQLQARGIFVRQALQPVEVIVDASLLYSLLDTMFDWAVPLTRGVVEIGVDMQAWPAHGRITLRFPFRAPDDVAPSEGPAGLDSLTWRLLAQTAQTLGVLHERRIDAMYVELKLCFPRTVSALVESLHEEPASSAGGESSFSSSLNSKPLAGSHVLVVAARRDVRVPVRQALASMGLVLDFVASVDEAAEFCAEALPHAIVVDSAHTGRRFDELVAGIRADVPDFVCIEIAEDGRDLQISGVEPKGYTRVGRDALLSALPSALVFELTRQR